MCKATPFDFGYEGDLSFIIAHMVKKVKGFLGFGEECGIVGGKFISGCGFLLKGAERLWKRK